MTVTILDVSGVSSQFVHEAAAQTGLPFDVAQRFRHGRYDPKIDGKDPLNSPRGSSVIGSKDQARIVSEADGFAEAFVLALSEVVEQPVRPCEPLNGVQNVFVGMSPE